MHRLCLGLIALFIWGPALAEDEVYFSDANLKFAVEAKLGISDPTPTDMLALDSLDAHGKGIRRLKGLESATNLTSLNLYDNQVSDLSPLSGLTRLAGLDLDDNQIRSITPLSRLTSLRTLDLDDNEISNIAALSNLTSLGSLYLEDNRLSNISALSDLNLTRLSLEDNQIRDISPLSGLTRLSHLLVENNGISDISALAGLNELRYLDLHENAISDLSPLSGLHELEYLDLHINRIRDIAALSGLSHLHTLNIYLNSITDIRPLAGLTGLQNLHLHYNQITDIFPLVNLTHLQVLELHKNPLNQAAYCSHLHALVINNPGLGLSYSPNIGPAKGVWASNGLYPNKIQISWAEHCNGPDFGSYYRVFRATSPDGPQLPISPWQSVAGFTDLAVDMARSYTYWIRTSTDAQGNGALGFFRPAVGWLEHDYTLTLSSTAGGSVVMPGLGTLLYQSEESVSVAAEPIDSHLYVFSEWTGTAVDAGRVTDSRRASTVVTVDGVYTMSAHFVTTLATLYVDDNGPADPGPGDSAVSDPHEDGTMDHPFDRVQEAVDVAADGVCVIVRAGSYDENIDLLGKQIELTGIDPNDSNVHGFPVINGSGSGPVIRFSKGEDQNCRLSGFVITRGEGDLAGGIYCQDSSPTIANCLIVGNRAMDPNGAAIYCCDSNAVFINCTIVDNEAGSSGAGIVMVNSSAVLTNSIVYGNVPQALMVRGDGDPLISFTDIAREPGPGNIDADPRFVQPGYWGNAGDLSEGLAPGHPGAVWVDGDYHLPSTAGRWAPTTQSWVQDGSASPCIDAGNPISPVAYEPIPHGDVVNLGAYGGTLESSKSY